MTITKIHYNLVIVPKEQSTIGINQTLSGPIVYCDRLPQYKYYQKCVVKRFFTIDGEKNNAKMYGKIWKINLNRKIRVRIRFNMLRKHMKAWYWTQHTSNHVLIAKDIFSPIFIHFALYNLLRKAIFSPVHCNCILMLISRDECSNLLVYNSLTINIFINIDYLNLIFLFPESY